jgi:zinc and cadmium transporter
MNFIFAIFASIVVSLISFIGAITLFLNERILQRVLLALVGFSAGSLIGGAFLHLLLESFNKKCDYLLPFGIVISGFTLFFYNGKIFVMASLS